MLFILQLKGGGGGGGGRRGYEAIVNLLMTLNKLKQNSAGRTAFVIRQTAELETQSRSLPYQ